jgi:hypothetical protein
MTAQSVYLVGYSASNFAGSAHTMVAIQAHCVCPQRILGHALGPTHFPETPGASQVPCISEDMRVSHFNSRKGQ